MVICQVTKRAYYPISDKGSALISGSARIRYFRGFILLRPKESGALIGSRSRPENGITDYIRTNKAIGWIPVRHEGVAAFAAGAEAHLPVR